MDGQQEFEKRLARVQSDMHEVADFSQVAG